MFTFDNVITAGTVLVRDQIESQNYTPSGGVSGWYIGSDGTATFNNAFFRGTLESANYTPSGGLLGWKLFNNGDAVLNSIKMPRPIIATLTSDGNLQVGPESDYNVVSDQFGIEGRQNGVATPFLALNRYGGSIWHGHLVANDALREFKTTGSIVAAVMRPVEQNDAGAYTTTSTVNVSLGSPPGLLFTAPRSGCVVVNHEYTAYNSVNGRFNVSNFQIEAGGAGGAVVFTGVIEPNAGLPTAGSADAKYVSMKRLVQGLTAGGTYYFRPLYRVNAASTGTFQFIYMMVQPQM